MFTNTHFEGIAKSLAAIAPKIDLGSVQEAFKPFQDNLQAWSDLAHRQLAEAQTTMMGNAEAFMAARDPMAFLEAYTSASAATVALVQKNMKDSLELSVSQIHGLVDALQKVHPAGEFLAPLANCLKSTASMAPAARTKRTAK